MPVDVQKGAQQWSPTGSREYQEGNSSEKKQRQRALEDNDQRKKHARSCTGKKRNKI